MAFPTNPVVNQSYSIGDKTWFWDGSKWTLLADNDFGEMSGYVKLEDNTST